MDEFVQKAPEGFKNRGKWFEVAHTQVPEWIRLIKNFEVNLAHPLLAPLPLEVLPLVTVYRYVPSNISLSRLKQPDAGVFVIGEELKINMLPTSKLCYTPLTPPGCRAAAKVLPVAIEDSRDLLALDIRRLTMRSDRWRVTLMSFMSEG